MNSFIEEFYYGNIDPQARSFEQNKNLLRKVIYTTNAADCLFDASKIESSEALFGSQYFDESLIK